MEEITSGVYQLKVPIPDNPLEYLLAYLIKGDGEYALVDTGWNTPEALEALQGQLAELRVDFPQIRYIFITHVHADHFGLAGKVKELSGAQIVMHEREKPFIASRYRRPKKLLNAMADWLIIHGVPQQDMPPLQRASMPVIGYVTPAAADIAVKGGEHFALGPWDLEVIWTPGHSAGHICLYDRNRRVLFSGDHILPSITPNISLHPQSKGNPLGYYLNSLKKMEELEADWVLPAHEGIIRDLRKRLRELEEHHEERLGSMLSAMNDGPRSAYYISSQVPWDIGPWEEISLWGRRAALTETLAHLEYLVREGRAEKLEENGVVLFRRAQG